jgi:hypothetical protein
MVRPLDESQGSYPLQGHGSWLMCEVALRAALHLEAGPIPLEAGPIPLEADRMKF